MDRRTFLHPLAHPKIIQSPARIHGQQMAQILSRNPPFEQEIHSAQNRQRLRCVDNQDTSAETWEGWNGGAGWPSTRTSVEDHPGEQPGQQQRQVERPPEGGQETSNHAGPQDEGLPVPADISAHGTVTAVRTDRPAVPPENEPQGQPEDHAAEHSQGSQRDAGSERRPGRGKGKRRPNGHHHPVALGAVSFRRPPGRAGSLGQPQHLRPASALAAGPPSPAPR